MNRLAELLNRPEITWWDAIDILLVSLLIYEALKLIRGTRAMQMAAGSVLVLVLFYMSQLFPLQTVAWLIRTVLVYVVFAVIVLFQSDIRRALSHLGSAPFFRYFARAERAAETIEEVAAAAGMLSKPRLARSSSSSARSDFGTTSKAGFRLTRKSATTCSRRSFSRRPRCTTAPPSSGKPGRGRGVLPAADRQSRARSGSRARVIVPRSA
jgi:hypothetical protein